MEQHVGTHHMCCDIEISFVKKSSKYLIPFKALQSYEIDRFRLISYKHVSHLYPPPPLHSPHLRVVNNQMC
jgi:hypothetical protein